MFSLCAAFVSVVLTVFLIFKGSCGDGDVRLVDGQKFTAYQEGRLEMCIDGEWLAVCGNGWTEENTQFVCRTLLQMVS